MIRERHWLAATGQSTRPTIALVGVLLLFAAVVRWMGWNFVSLDKESFGLWVKHLQQHGFHGLATINSNYNPPYLYLLLIGNVLVPSADPITIVKCVSTVFDLVLALAVALSVLRYKASKCWLSPLLGFSITLALPTVFVNSAIWGQCDAIFTSFLLFSLLAAEGGNSIGLASGFATALAFKLQSAFTGPTGLAVFVTLRRQWLAAVSGVAIYLLWLLPSVVAGRSWSDLLTVYVRQATPNDALALGAPNLWTLAKHALPGPTGWRIGLIVGFVLTLAFVAAWVPFARRQVLRTPEQLMALAFTSAFMLPFLLPKMHERYFFPADIIGIVLVARDRRWLLTAVLVQIGSITGYIPFLTNVNGRMILPIGIAANCIVVGLLVLHWQQVRRTPSLTTQPAA